MDNLRLHHKFLEEIKSQVSSANFRAWFTKTQVDFFDEEKVILSTPSAFIKETLSQRHMTLIQQALFKITGKKLNVEFKIKNGHAEKEEETSEEDIFQPARAYSTPLLNPKYTLQNFVVGPSNNVAYAAAQAIVQNPALSYNPLFIYGGTGVGKTHLMVGVGNALQAKKPNLKIIYCSSEKFTNDYVEAIQTRKMADLRNKYRSANLLLVDDAQFFSGREQTQEEFFHTFNELLAKNSQIILTSDRTPEEMPKLEARLRSRFQGGLMVDIQTPDLDTRVAILRAKCQERGEYLPEDCLNLIASYVESNARELEGKLVFILQVLKTRNLPPSSEVIRKYLGQKDVNKIKELSPKTVISSICHYFDIKPSDLTGPRRQKGLIMPRHIAMHILSEDLRLTVEAIGELLGGRDHTTVMHGRDKIKGLISSDRNVQKIVIEIRQKLSTN